ncbi:MULTISPECIES: hypothetical protein [Mesorhizobium]|uniref:Uncharacterized protein n=1 Tax=Mesorhizobium opportunistum (strain LMG 24607 / HAMBI 3007 / WSM2075) TaxID=536019 RepID=F7YHH5_MESOW|nr:MULTISPECIES: hypothetical protein [Mesorhizobium]AEH89275.1 hypothetical protein Mesop_4855 [Mesorhizobium opportunistum WSM2075]MCA0031780.1 hypothetical protein [Mesorhizobium sp. B263B2A]
MSDQTQTYVECEVGNDLSNDEVFAWVDQALEQNKNMAAIGINVSNSLHQRGLTGEHRGVKIAMDPSLYPRDVVRIQFGPKKSN